MQFQQSTGGSRISSMNQARGCMYLPGMAPSTEGAKIVIKPRSNWRERNLLQDAQNSADVLVPETPVGNKLEPYRDSRNDMKKELLVPNGKISPKSIKVAKLELEQTKEKAKPVLELTEPSIVADAAVAEPNNIAEKSTEKESILIKDAKCARFVNPRPRAAVLLVDHFEDEERIQELRNRLAAIDLEREVELKVIEQELQQAKLDMRRSVNKEEADTLKEHMKCSETAKMGRKLIKKLRKDNARLRESNAQLAKDIHELAQENANLEESIKVANESKKVVEAHFDQIKASNEKLNMIVPQYQAKIAALEEALNERTQYAQSERHIKILYATLLSTVSEMMESHCKDQELTDEVLELVLDCNESISLTSEHMDLPTETNDK